MRLYVLGDTHVGASTFNEKLFHDWLRRFREDKSKKAIILNGDLVDMLDSDRFYKPADVPTLNESIDYIVDNLYPFKKYIIANLPGNHECFDEDTELLTSEGWVKYYDIDENTLVGTFNKDTKELQYQRPTYINIEYVEDELIHLESRSIDTLTTKNHRFYYTYAHDERTLKHMKMEEIQNIHNTEIVLRQACQNNNEEYPITDNEIKLIAWCLTDSHYNKRNNGITFYQRKSQVNRILDLLKSLNISYNYRERNRDITHICGKKLKKRPETNCEIDLNSKEGTSVKKLCPSHTIVPDFVSKFSKRQFMIFLDELVFCDGSKHKSSSNSWVLYKSKDFLDQIQILCIQNDIRTSLTEYRKGCYRLNIAIKYNRSRIRNNQEIIDYKGIIWCVTVPNDTLIVRRNGKTVITGNSRAIKKFDLDISKLIGDQLGVETAPSFHKDVEIGKNRTIRVFAQHNAPVSKSTLLAMRRFMDTCNGIDAELFIGGHNHRAMGVSKVFRGLDYKPYRKHYVFNGCFLNYQGSYGEGKYDYLLPCYPVIDIHKKTKNVQFEIYYEPGVFE